LIDMPIRNTSISIIDIRNALNEVITDKVGLVYVTLEKQHFYSSDGKDRIWTAAMGYATIMNALELLNETHPGINLKLVSPYEWKTHFGVIVPTTTSRKAKATNSSVKKLRKELTRDRVLSIYKDADIFGSRGGLKDGRSDALLIARYEYELQRGIKRRENVLSDSGADSHVED